MTDPRPHRYIIRRDFYGAFRVSDLAGVSRDQTPPTYEAARRIARALEARAAALDGLLARKKAWFLSLDTGGEVPAADPPAGAGSPVSTGAGPTSPTDGLSSPRGRQHLPPSEHGHLGGAIAGAARLFPGLEAPL